MKITCKFCTTKCRSPTSKASSLGDRIKNDPMLVLRNFLQLVIHDCSSSIDMFACFVFPATCMEGGSADWRTCSVSTH